MCKWKGQHGNKAPFPLVWADWVSGKRPKLPYQHIYCQCATSKGVEAMVPNRIFEETNPFLESAQQRWLDMAGPDVLLLKTPLAKRNGIYLYVKQDMTDS